eukprot:TRINITY_DN128_c0_g1_i7.p1 TRINITY_DN128_c0_g1~~TRINITY_DN128_c0_g1_i7.p1  ORF type:complete len:160 (+),score=36.58 TRINITY_DN128_c0_g1_i7:460-939(+)
MGCCGAAKESRPLLGFYVFILSGIIAGLIVVGYTASALNQNMDEILQEGWDNLNEEEIELIENDFICCGFNNITYQDTNCTLRLNTTETCGQKLGEFIDIQYIILQAVAFFIGAVLICSVIFSFCLCCVLPTKEDIAEEQHRKLIAESEKIISYNSRMV